MESLKPQHRCLFEITVEVIIRRINLSEPCIPDYILNGQHSSHQGLFQPREQRIQFGYTTFASPLLTYHDGNLPDTDSCFLYRTKILYI